MSLLSAPSAVGEALAAIEPEELTPKQTLEALYRLKKLLSRAQKTARFAQQLLQSA